MPAHAPKILYATLQFCATHTLASKSVGTKLGVKPVCGLGMEAYQRDGFLNVEHVMFISTKRTDPDQRLKKPSSH